MLVVLPVYFSSTDPRVQNRWKQLGFVVFDVCTDIATTTTNTIAPVHFFEFFEILFLTFSMDQGDTVLVPPSMKAVEKYLSKEFLEHGRVTKYTNAKL
jgi:hypothetical protein